VRRKLPTCDKNGFNGARAKKLTVERQAQLVIEKDILRAEFNIRLKDAQFIHFGRHTAEQSDEQFQRFLNGRMTEDSFWGITKV